MRKISLRAQVIIIVMILTVGLAGAIIYITDALGSAKESIVRLNRTRLSSLTDNLSRRYGLVLNFVASSQIEDSSLAQRDELKKLLMGITKEELQKSPDIQAGFYSSLWNKELVGTPQTIGVTSFYDRFFHLLVQSALEEQREQWTHHASAGGDFIIVVKPVYARNRLLGVAWAIDDLAEDFAQSWPADVTPLLQLAIVFGIALATFFIIHLRREVYGIQRGLEAMKGDISKRLPTSSSEFGYIASSINGLADTVARQQEEREALQTVIQQKEKLASLGQLIAGVAHEIRTPLAAIKTRVQLWQRSRIGKRSNAARLPKGIGLESMTLVLQELNRIEGIVQKLLFFSKQRKPRLRKLNLHDTLNAAVETLQDEMKKHRIRITKNFALNNPEIFLDESEIREVILNLLTNAIEAMPKRGSLTIETSNQPLDTTVSFCVKDSGKGIKQEIATKIFDPFFTTKETGTGLGLSIAYEIVRSHNGTITCARNSNGGSRFTVTLPRNGAHELL